MKRAGCLSKEERFPTELPSGDTLGPSEWRLEAPVGRQVNRVSSSAAAAGQLLQSTRTEVPGALGAV